jgi:hypothetical protein
MGRKRLTLQVLVAAGAFDASNWRHRRALDESEPLEDPELELRRQLAVYFRDGRNDAKVMQARRLREFAEAVADRRD